LISAPVFQRGALNQACEQISIPRLTPHELRHTAASLVTPDTLTATVTGSVASGPELQDLRLNLPAREVFS
jgi:hypothetical protein